MSVEKRILKMAKELQNQDVEGIAEIDNGIDLIVEGLEIIENGLKTFKPSDAKEKQAKAKITEVYEQALAPYTLDLINTIDSISE